MKGMEKYLDVIFKKVKNYFANYPEFTLGIMNSLGKAIETYDLFKEFITFVGGIVSNEHNSKKKLNFLKMTEGAIESL